MKSSFLKFYGRDHELVASYDIRVLQIVMDLLLVIQQQIDLFSDCIDPD